MIRKKILILANSDSAIFKFRAELIQALEKEFEIGIGVPFGDYINDIRNDKYTFFNIPVNRHGHNPFEDLKLHNKYLKTIKDFSPDVVLLYTIKPNIYGSIACAKRQIPSLCNITGLGTAVENPGILQKILIVMYRFALKKEHTIFFQNEHGRDFFRRKRIGVEKQYCMLPGSGVNLNKFIPMSYPDDDIVRFVFVARIIKEKGIEEFLEIAKRFHDNNLNAEFHICGQCEQDYSDILSELSKNGIINYHGLVKDMREIYKNASCIVLPSFYPEGQSNVLLEGAACCRPLITTNHPGCREAVDDGITGFLVKIQDADDLYEKVYKMYMLPRLEREKMGMAGRSKVEKEFDRDIVISRYLERIRDAIN